MRLWSRGHAAQPTSATSAAGARGSRSPETPGQTPSTGARTRHRRKRRLSEPAGRVAPLRSMLLRMGKRALPYCCSGRGGRRAARGASPWSSGTEQTIEPAQRNRRAREGSRRHEETEVVHCRGCAEGTGEGGDTPPDGGPAECADAQPYICRGRRFNYHAGSSPLAPSAGRHAPPSLAEPPPLWLRPP